MKPMANGSQQPVILLENVEKIYKTKGRALARVEGRQSVDQRGRVRRDCRPVRQRQSTLINMITGIDRPTSGEVYVAGQRLTKLSENAVAKWRGKNVGVVFQFFQLLPT